ncbi:MAG: DUF72 domain-containing protein, partial [Thermotogae bacterium]|nr:DUF72 domain-containing protein [Thermotogota bacterium]
DYFYNDNELRMFAEDIKKISNQVEKTYVFFNNCHNGSAVKNALNLSKLLN